jgi:hypothetical protein
MHIRAAVPHCEVRDVVAGGYYIESPGDGDYMLFVAELGVGETVRLQVLDERDKNIGSITYELVEIIVAPVLAARLKRTVDARPFPKFEELKKEVEDEGERALQEKLRTGNHHPQEDVIVESRRETNR